MAYFHVYLAVEKDVRPSMSCAAGRRLGSSCCCGGSGGGGLAAAAAGGIEHCGPSGVLRFYSLLSFTSFVRQQVAGRALLSDLGAVPVSSARAGPTQQKSA